MRGAQFCRKLRNRMTCSFVVPAEAGTQSRTDDDTYAQAKRLGADASLTKPILRKELIEGVLKLLYK